MKALIKCVTAVCVAGFLSACGGGETSNRTIAEQAQSNNLTALLAAVNKAGLTNALAASNASLTVFAPTNAAFNTLATQLGFVDATALVAALSPADLSKILSYHLLPGVKSAQTLKAEGANQSTAYSYAGSAASLRLDTRTGVAITDAALTTAQVSTADVSASNGIIHVVNKVLIPPGVLNVVQMAQVNPDTFSALVGAVVTANLAGTLSGSGPFTVFAPTNEAFTAAASTAAGLSTSQLASVLKYHVLAGQVLSSDIPLGTALPTLNTNNLSGSTVPAQTITINDNPLRIADTTSSAAPIVATDVRASNGVIHVIGKVLIPN